MNMFYESKVQDILKMLNVTAKETVLLWVEGKIYRARFNDLGIYRFYYYHPLYEKEDYLDVEPEKEMRIFHLLLLGKAFIVKFNIEKYYMIKTNFSNNGEIIEVTKGENTLLDENNFMCGNYFPSYELAQKCKENYIENIYDNY